jgi:hypothetical protein
MLTWTSNYKRKPFAATWCIITILCIAACANGVDRAVEKTVANTPTQAVTPAGQYISWIEHIIDDEQVNGGIPIRGGDGIASADFDRDGYVDFVTAQEDSNHLRVAYGTSNPTKWHLRTLAEGASVGAIEDVSVGDLNGDGWIDVVAACEDAHLIYLQNPAEQGRDTAWKSHIPTVTQGRGSWLRVFAADFNGDGRLDLSAANKGAPDIVRPGIDAAENGATSIFTIDGPPLDDESWSEQVIYFQGVPNTALPLDVDSDGDVDVLAAKRVKQELVLLLNDGRREDGLIEYRPFPIEIEPAFEAAQTWQGLTNAFQAETADLNGDGRLDIVVNVLELGDGAKPPHAGLGWLEQPTVSTAPWRYHRIGNTLPDWITGIHLTDIDGDGDLDAMTGGYSGLNILVGSYSGASRDYDEPGVGESATVGRIAWFENPGDASGSWMRHDVSRRVRGMYDMFISLDLDGDGDLDIVAPRGNSGKFDGVFWLEQVRSDDPRPAFTQARKQESRQLSLPPENWLEVYDRAETFIAPNKAE